MGPYKMFLEFLNQRFLIFENYILSLSNPNIIYHFTYITTIYHLHPNIFDFVFLFLKF